MTKPLENVTVAITEHRYTTELATLFERLGAHVYVCPLMEEQPVDNRDGVQEFVRLVTSGALDMMIFLTGVGVRFLIAEAESMGCRSELIAKLGELKVVARGPKPVAALRQAGVKVDITPQIPTSTGIAETLSGHDLRGKRVGLQLYGVDNPGLCSALTAQGADVRTVQVYKYGPASDRSAIDALVNELISGQIEVIAFTSAFQVHFLFEAADDLGSGSELKNRLNDGTVVASIGEVTSRALAKRGVSPKITAHKPTMASLVNGIAEFFQHRNV